MTRRSSEASASTATIGGGCCLINLLLGGVMFQYCLFSVFGKDVPWYADFVAGLFLGQFLLPVTIVVWIMRLCGVDVPFVH